MFKFMHKFLRTEKGATAIEYALVASLIAAVIVGSINALGQGIVTTLYDKIAAVL
jgi:pilus assembly protein Flp/PilA